MSDQIAVNHEIAKQKRKTWGNMGVGVYTGEIALQLRAQQIESTLILPTDIRDLTNAEQTLKIAKQNRDILIEDRKKITGRLNDVIDRLMKPEKSIEVKINEFSVGLLQLKKQASEVERLEQQKSQELKQVTEMVRLYIADMNAAICKEANKVISESYEYALEKVPPEGIDEYLAKVISLRFTQQKFTIAPPVYKAQLNTQKIVDDEIAKAFNPRTPDSYIDGFTIDIKNKYSDYKLAWQNKTQAIELNKREAEETNQAIDYQKQNQVVAANVQALAATPVVSYAGKPLKELYKLEMDETFEHANIICMAYIANSIKCREKIRVTKWLTGFGTKQMVDALEKIKNEDENFNFNGLIWKKTDKL